MSDLYVSLMPKVQGHRKATFADLVAVLRDHDGVEELPAFPMRDSRYPDAQYDAIVVNRPGRYLVVPLDSRETSAKRRGTNEGERQ